MSRNQWIVIGLLALAVALVFGFLGAYLLMYLRGAPETSVPVQPIHIATEAPLDTIEPTTTEGPPTPTTALSSADYGYRLCLQDVAAGSMELVEDLGLVASMGTDGQSAVCAAAARLDLQRRVADLRRAHENCPLPLDAHLQAAHSYYDSGLAEYGQAADSIGRHCAGGSDIDLLDEAITHANQGIELTSLAQQEMHAYYASD